MEKQSFAGLIGAGAGGVIGAANLPDDATTQERARYAARGAIRGGGIGSGMSAGIALGELGRRMALKGQAKPSMTRQVIATLLPMLGGGLGSYAGYEIADEFARNPALGTDDEANAGDKAKADKREERMEKEKQAADTIMEGPNGETFTLPSNVRSTSVPRTPYPRPEITARLVGDGLKPTASKQPQPFAGKPSAWDYLKNPLKNLATGGSYAKEQGMSRLYDENYYPHTLKGPKPAAGNSIRKAIAPMENNPMGGYSTPTQGVLTPYPRNKQGADGILSGLLGPSEAEKAKAIEEEKLEKAVARNVRERLARRIAKEKMAEDAAGIAYLNLILEKEAGDPVIAAVQKARNAASPARARSDAAKVHHDNTWKRNMPPIRSQGPVLPGAGVDQLAGLQQLEHKARNLGRKTPPPHAWKSQFALPKLMRSLMGREPRGDAEFSHAGPGLSPPVPPVPSGSAGAGAGAAGAAVAAGAAKKEAKDLQQIKPVKPGKGVNSLRDKDVSRRGYGLDLLRQQLGIGGRPTPSAYQGTNRKLASDQEALKSLVLEKIAKSPAWQRKAGKNSEGGLNAKGRASYNKSTGGNLKAPVTSKKPKGKAKKRKASFCARMSGMKKKNTSKSTANDPDSRINKSLRKWNC